MEANYHYPYNPLVAESPPLQPVRPSLNPLGDLTWEPLTFEEHRYNDSDLFLEADSSFSELGLSKHSEIRHILDEYAYDQAKQPMPG